MIETNAARIREALQRMDRGLMPALARGFEAGALALLPYVATYPPAPPTSQYVRTGTLGRTWTASQPHTTSTEASLVTRIGNTTPYGARVQDEIEQARAFRGRWKPVQRIEREHRGEVEEQIQIQLDLLMEHVTQEIA